jgi:hypothetical protein
MRLGPYVIIGRLAGGGMGEVHRARDTRLLRDVAIKIVRAGAGAPAESAQRFEQEARAAGALSHANVLTVFDVGSHEGMPFIVLELLEGATLREKLARGPLAPGEACELAVQLARGLAAAHAGHIVHRDLKPENVFVTRDRVVKILDFGIARLDPAIGGTNGGDDDLPNSSTLTRPGTVLGTLGYMSPEQVRGQRADERSDIFSFGAVLHEMLTGRRAFDGATSADVMAAILERHPVIPPEAGPLAGALHRVAARCVAKDPRDRIQSARDLEFALEDARLAAPAVRRGGRVLLAGVAAVAALALAALAVRSPAPRPAPVAPAPQLDIQRVTYRHGQVFSARFVEGSRDIVYAASWGGEPLDIFSTRHGNPEANCLNLAGTDLLSISAAGELALKLDPRVRDVADPRGAGTLARRPLAGGAPRELRRDVQYADWAADGETLIVVAEVDGLSTIEAPAGTVVYRTAARLSHPRRAPAGDRVAFLEHPRGSEGGSVRLVDRAGQARTLASGFSSLDGLAWGPRGDEIWFAGARSGGLRSLVAVDLEGHERAVYAAPATLTLHDVARDGRVLVTETVPRYGLIVRAAGRAQETDMSWFDGSEAADLSADGRHLLFSETRDAGRNATYERDTDCSPAVRLGDGKAAALSPDGAWAAAIAVEPPRRVTLFPVGPGEPRPLEHAGIEAIGASWFSDGRQLLLAGTEGTSAPRLFVLDLAGAAPRAVTPPGVWRNAAVTADGSAIAAVGLDDGIWLYPSSGGEGRALGGTSAGDLPARFTADGRQLYVYEIGAWPVPVTRLDLASGKRTPWLELRPPDAASCAGIVGKLLLTGDGKFYAYTYDRSVTDLFVIGGLR